MTSLAFFEKKQRASIGHGYIPIIGNYIINYITTFYSLRSVNIGVVNNNYIINYIVTSSPLSLSHQLEFGVSRG